MQLPPLAYEYVVSADRLPQIAQEIVSAQVIALDLETTGFYPVNGARIRLCSINTGKAVYVIDVFRTQTLGPVATALSESKAIKVGHNLKFDQKFLLFYEGIELWPIFDSFRSSQVMHNGRKMAHDLWSVQEREIGARPRTEDLGGSDWSAPELTKAQLDYAADDVISLPFIRLAMKPKLAALGLNKVALIEFGAILPECAVEINGFYLNATDWEILAHKNVIRRKELQERLWADMPDPNQQLGLPFAKKLSSFNLDSPSQMLDSLRMMGCRVDDTKEMTLAMVASKYPIINTILDYREAAQRVKSFGVDYLENISSSTGRVHAEFFPFLLAGRYACSKPNLAQIPRAKEFRACFQAPPGYRLVLADYSGIEMRIVAEIANDGRMIQVFRENKDAHKVTASILLGIPYDQIDKGKKQQAKPVNFGFIYGMMPPKLVLYAKAGYGVTLTLAQASEFREKYMDYYNAIPRWHDRALRDGKRQKMAFTLAGRLRYLEDENAHNEFFNTPVQGTGADGLKSSLREVYFRLKKRIGHAPVKTPWNPDPAIKMVHHVHDEIILEPKDTPELIEISKTELTGGMQTGMSQFLKKVPVEVEAADGSSWADK